MQTEPRDQSIEQIEADLRESRFTKWDVETFLENRHKAKIERLQKAESQWAVAWEGLKEVSSYILARIGAAAILLVFTLWLVTGVWPPLVIP